MGCIWMMGEIIIMFMLGIIIVEINILKLGENLAMQYCKTVVDNNENILILHLIFIANECENILLEA